MVVESFLGLALLEWYIVVRKYRSFWEFHYGVFSARRGVFHGVCLPYVQDVLYQSHLAGC
jgi:hypothetical protein